MSDDETDSKDFALRIDLSNSSQVTTATDFPELLAVPESVRQKYKKDGFVIFPSVLTLEDVAALNDRLEKILRGDYDRRQKPDKAPRLLKSEYQAGQFSSSVPNSNGSSPDASTTLTEVIPSDDNNKGPRTTSNGKDKKKKNSRAAMGPLGFSGNLQNVKVLQVINVHKADHLFRRLAVSPALGKTVAELAGWQQGARLAQDQVWAKPPGAPPLVFHRDSPYFMVSEFRLCFTNRMKKSQHFANPIFI